MTETTPENIVLNVSDLPSDAGSKEKSLECACCADTFTKSTRAAVICPNGCGYHACKECVRTYLLNTAESPHCMNCKSPWNERFLVANLNSSFMNNQYKKHRKQLLLERQLSMLPDTMPALERVQRIRTYEAFRETQITQIRELKQTIRQLEETIGQAYRNAYSDHHYKNDPVKKFILPCPDDDCRGFLSSAYKCELCQCYACPKCLVLTGKERHDESHVCDEELVKTADLIRKTSKPCPSCGERIIKSSGCDQMWCVKCHTAFSWRTGQIDKGIIHNPHFNQYQRQLNNGLTVRNPGDIVCGGLHGDFWRVRQTLRNILKSYEDPSIKRNLIGKFSELFHFMRHVNGHELPNYRLQVRTLENNEELRVKYLIKDISKEVLANETAKRDKKRRKIIEIMHIYEIIVAVGNDLVNHLCDFVLNVSKDTSSDSLDKVLIEEFTKKFQEYDNFIDYVNDQFKMISVTYSQKVMQIEKDTYSSISQRFMRSDLETFA